MTKYLPTVDGKPARFSGEQLCVAGGRNWYVLPLDSLRLVRAQIKRSQRFRAACGYDKTDAIEIVSLSSMKSEAKVGSEVSKRAYNKRDAEVVEHRGVTNRTRPHRRRPRMATAHATTPSKFVSSNCPTCGSEGVIVSADWLRHARVRAGLTLREMARRLSFSAPYICDIEHGRRACTPDIRSAYEAL